jgi:cyd operon protein YbgT
MVEGGGDMWYFAWILGVGFAVLLAVLNAMWGESEEGRTAEMRTAAKSSPTASSLAGR